MSPLFSPKTSLRKHQKITIKQQQQTLMNDQRQSRLAERTQNIQILHSTAVSSGVQKERAKTLRIFKNQIRVFLSFYLSDRV